MRIFDAPPPPINSFQNYKKMREVKAAAPVLQQQAAAAQARGSGF